MAAKRSTDQEDMEKLLDEFREAQQDVDSVNDVEQPLELHVSGTTAYIPSYTRHVMDQGHGAPIMAVVTRTGVKAMKVFIHPAADPKAKGARKLRNDETLGPVHFAFGVPLRKLGLKIPVSRRVVLPLTPLQTPEHGTVYWATFAEIETERRDVDMEAIAAAKQAKAEQAKARKASRGKKRTPEQGAASEA